MLCGLQTVTNEEVEEDASLSWHTFAGHHYTMLNVMVFFWVLEPCRVVGRSQRFREI
jgi:hypothetical protein